MMKNYNHTEQYIEAMLKKKGQLYDHGVFLLPLLQNSFITE